MDFILNRVFVVLILFCLFLFKLKFALNKILGISRNIIDQRTKLKVLLFFQNKTWKIVDSLAINDFSKSKMDATAAELVEERDTAVTFLGV